MCQTAARHEVENFYALINQWKETRCLIETKLCSISHEDSIQVIQELDKMEEHLKLTPEWNSCRTMNDVRLVILGTVESRKSLLVNKYLYGTLDVEIPDELEIRHKKDFYMEGKNQLLLIREISGEPSTQVAIWADTMMFVFNLENMESFNSIYTSYQQVIKYRSNRGLDSIPTVLIGIQGSAIQRCVTHSDAISLATNHMNNSPYIEVIPEDGINVESSFQRACKPVLFSHTTYNFNRTKKSTSINTHLDEIANDENGHGPYKLIRQSSLPSSHERAASQSFKRKKVNKKFYQMKSNYEISNGVPLLGTGRDIPIKESKILKRGNKRKKDWKKKLLVLTQNTLTYYPTTHDYMNQINGKSINLLHCTVKIPGKDPTGVTRSNINTSMKNAETFPRALRMHSISESSGRKMKMKINDQDPSVGFMSDGVLTDMSDEEDIFSASAVFSKPNSFINPLFTNTPSSPMDDTLMNKLFRSAARKDTSSDPEEDIPGGLYSSVDTSSADKKKTPKKLQTYLKSGHVRGKSDATLQKFLIPAVPDNNIATFEFHVISLDGRYWVFDAGSSEEQGDWIKVIEHQIHAALTATTGDRKAIRPSLIVSTSEVEGIRNVQGNDFCCDCLAPDPEWASINLGTVICVHCSSVHRQLGTHISRIKSLELDEWTILQLSLASSLGNDLARSVWEATSELNGYAPPDYTCCTRKERETWIRLKYEEKVFLRNVYKDTNSLRERLISSVERGDLQDVYSLLPYCTPDLLNYQDPTNKQTVLHTSVIANNSPISLLLVWNHIDSQLEDTHGKRAIEYAHSPLCDVLAQLTSTCPIQPLKSFAAV